jgi:hypothetical protein
VLAANYPFATIEPNIGVVGVPDPRLAGARGQLFASARLVPATSASSTSPGSSGRQPGRRGWATPSSAHIREADADLPGDPRVPRPRRQPRRRAVDPPSDIETISTELILATCRPRAGCSRRLEKDARINKEKQPMLAAVSEAPGDAGQRPDGLRAAWTAGCCASCSC